MNIEDIKNNVTDLFISGKKAISGLSSKEQMRRWALDRVAGGTISAASSEAVASQLAGREHGPADAYRHILWAAELTRVYGERYAREILKRHDDPNSTSIDAGSAMDESLSLLL